MQAIGCMAFKSISQRLPSVHLILIQVLSLETQFNPLFHIRTPGRYPFTVSVRRVFTNPWQIFMRVLNGALIGVIVAVAGFTMTTAADPDTLPKQSAPNPESSTDAETDTWKSLFDGKTLGLWKPTRFGGEGEVSIQDGTIQIAMGSDMSGITWSGVFPEQHYEISMDASRVDGTDFFCGLTFPVGKNPCSFIVGGWGGGICGLSSIDGLDAARNDTTKWREFKTGQWYAIRVRVSPNTITCWIDDEKMVEQPLKGRTLSIRDEVAASKPLGIASFATTAGIKNIRFRPIDETPSNSK